MNGVVGGRWSLYSNKIGNDKFEGTFHIEGALKDVSYVPGHIHEPLTFLEFSHIRSISATHNSPMPIIDGQSNQCRTGGGCEISDA